MKVEFKVSVWERFSIPEELEDEVLELIKRGEITNGFNLSKYLVDKTGCIDTEIIYGSEEYLTPEKNSVCGTLEVWREGNKVYDNSRKDG